MLKLQEITEEYLASFAGEEKKKNSSNQKPKEKEAPKSLWERILSTITRGATDKQVSVHDLEPLSTREQTAITLNTLFPQSETLQKELAREQEPVLSKTAWQDFSLLCGNKSTPEASVLNALKKTQTTAGACVMATQLINPHTDRHLIEEKQQVVRLFNKETELQNNVDKALQKIKQGEATRLSLWKEDNPLCHKAYKKSLNRFYFFDLPVLRSLSGSMFALQLWKMLTDLFINRVSLTFLMILVQLYLREINAFFTGYWSHYGENFFFPEVARGANFWTIAMTVAIVLFLPFYFTVTGLWYTHWSLETIQIGDRISIIDLFRSSYYREVGLILFIDLLMLFFFYLAYRVFAQKRGILNFLADHLATLQDLVLSARQISDLVAKHPALEKIYGRHLAKTRALLETSKGNSELGQLIYNLETTTLRNRWYFFSNTGRLLITYKLLQKHKDALADLTYEMGHIDVQVSIAKLVKESEAYAPENRFIFGTFEESQNNAPKLQVTSMWNILLDAKIAIVNDLNIKNETIVLTGPNAGGKTVYILGNGTNTITNQVWGIAAAKTFHQTIFYKIITYVNVTQNLAAGLSLAEAGMEILKEHKEVLNRVDKPILAIIDEILNGVDPEVAKKYSYKILKDRSERYPNCATLLTTHYMNLTELANENSMFTNKKVVVKIPGSNGRPFDYTYQIHDGVTDIKQNVVEMMLEEKGIL